jgi:two-component system sensor histidine kinase DegS
VLREVDAAIHRIPSRLRHKRFWEIQMLVAVATAAHYAVEIQGYTTPEGAVHDLAISLYMLPLLYAALSFGWEGALMTAIWGALLTSPSTWIWHHGEDHWISEVGQLGIIMGVGIIVAWRVDMESKQRLIAERTSASLRLLNKVGEVLSNTLNAESQLPQVVDEVQSALGMQAIVVSLAAESAETDPVIVSAGRFIDALTTRANGAMSDLDSGRNVSRLDGRTVIVALRTEGGLLGYLGASAPQNATLSDEHSGLLENLAHEITVAVENGRLYRQRQESMQSYVRQVTQAHEDERLRIARELHDETAQELVHLVRRLERLERDEGGTAAEAKEAVAVARNILSGVRRFSRDLRPSVLDDLGLIAAIEMVVDQNDKILPGGASLRTTGHPRRLEPQVELALFRIAQEALRNVSKHAQANTVSVTLAFEPDHVCLTVADDGKGFAPPTNVSDLSRLGKLGVLGMKERAELVTGTFELRSMAGKGTEIAVRVPC